jgi:hypothetical protein
MRVDMGFQAEGIACALSDHGAHAAALEALGASDTLTGDAVRPRDLAPSWSSAVAPRIAAARAALGDDAADAAYARGRSLTVEAVVELMLAFGESTVAA